MNTFSTGANNQGESLWQVALTYEEIEEIIALIDDEPVDEDFLTGIRKKLVKRLKTIRAKERRMAEA